MHNIFDKNFENIPYGVEQGREGTGLARPSSYLVTGPIKACPAPIRSIPKIFIKNILHSDIFPGHSSSFMTFLLCGLCHKIQSGTSHSFTRSGQTQFEVLLFLKAPPLISVT